MQIMATVDSIFNEQMTTSVLVLSFQYLDVSVHVLVLRTLGLHHHGLVTCLYYPLLTNGPKESLDVLERPCPGSPPHTHLMRRLHGHRAKIPRVFCGVLQ